MLHTGFESDEVSPSTVSSITAELMMSLKHLQTQNLYSSLRLWEIPFSQKYFKINDLYNHADGKKLLSQTTVLFKLNDQPIDG